MTGRDATHDFYDPDAGGEALRVRRFAAGPLPHEPARTNYFAVYRIESGAGTVTVGDARHPIGRGSLLFAVPYQYVRLAPDGPVAGAVIEFHANFLCVETFHAEVGCSGRLFNDPYGVPVVTPDPPADAEFAGLFARVEREQAGRGLAYAEVSLAYVKVLLVLASRLKGDGGPACGATGAAHRHPLLTRFAALVEARYRAWHSAGEYADALHVTAKALGRAVREHLGTTPTELIRRRVLTHAKWQLLHTLRPVKEIAAELGFADELYFSRLFKKAAGVSPTFFREFETAVRGGSNLSMPSARPSIPPAAASADNEGVTAGDPGTSPAAAPRSTHRGRGHVRAETVRDGSAGGPGGGGPDAGGADRRVPVDRRAEGRPV